MVIVWRIAGAHGSLWGGHHLPHPHPHPPSPSPPVTVVVLVWRIAGAHGSLWGGHHLIRLDRDHRGGQETHRRQGISTHSPPHTPHTLQPTFNPIQPITNSNLTSYRILMNYLTLIQP